MKSATRTTRRRRSGFTLAELLASLLFLAIVIPAAVHALRIASLAGSVSARKGAAARIADRVLNESLVLTNWSNASQRGTVSEENTEFQWTLSRANWTVQDIQLLTAEVSFKAQGRDYSVRLSTLADSADLNPGSTTSATRTTGTQ
jgi:type II secretory pathway pseudopilin PulG